MTVEDVGLLGSIYLVCISVLLRRLQKNRVNELLKFRLGFLKFENDKGLKGFLVQAILPIFNKSYKILMIVEDVGVLGKIFLVCISVLLRRLQKNRVNKLLKFRFGFLKFEMTRVLKVP